MRLSIIRFAYSSNLTCFTTAKIRKYSTQTKKTASKFWSFLRKRLRESISTKLLFFPNIIRTFVSE